MGVGVVDALAAVPADALGGPEQVVGPADFMPALAEDGAVVAPADGLGGGAHVGLALDGLAGEDLCLGQVGGGDGGQGEQLGAEGLDGVVGQKLGPAGGDHDGVDHDVGGVVISQALGDDVDEGGGRDHADLHRVGVDVGEHGVDLLAQKVRADLIDAGDAGGVLGR